MKPAPDISQTYPKTSLTLDSRFTAASRFVSDGSAYFDGDSGKISVSAATGINALFGAGGTMSLWMLPYSDGESNYGRIGEAMAGGWQIILRDESGSGCKVSFGHDFSTTDGIWKTSSASINLNVWNHVAFCYNGASVSNDPVVYVNGKSVSMDEITTPVGTVAADTADKVFGNEPSQTRTFDGYMCNIGLWKGTILTAAQVKEVMMASSYGQVVNVAQPTAYYPLSTNGNDSTGNYNGTLA